MSASTSPQDVVRSYLGALQERDESAAASLTTGPCATGDVWVADPPRIEDVEVLPAVPESTTGTVGEGYAEAVFVPVTFDLHRSSSPRGVTGRTRSGGAVREGRIAG